MTTIEPITLDLTEFQAGEVDYGLDIDAADHHDEPIWGKILRPSRTRYQLVITGTQLARDRALYRITSSRDIFYDNAGDSFGDSRERLAAASRGRSLDGLTRRLINAAGGPEGFSPDARRWIRH